MIHPPHRLKQSKSKDTKLDLFGFDDVDAHQDDNSNSGSEHHAEGGSSYKIKYFGFDDMSDSDGGEDNVGGFKHSKERRRIKKAAVTMGTPEILVEDEPDVDPPDPFEKLEIQRSPSAKEKKKNSERQEHKARAGSVQTHTQPIFFPEKCLFALFLVFIFLSF